MKFTESFDFDYPADVIIRMFGNKQYYRDKYERLGGARPEIVDCSGGEGHFSITVRHALDAAKLSFPDFIKKRIGDRLMLRQSDRWDTNARTGRIDIDIEKAPVEIVIQMNLGEAGAGSRLNLDFSIDASIPLVGGKIEKAVAGPITRHMKKDLTVSNRLAANYAA